jgi:hypothetical protein
VPAEAEQNQRRNGDADHVHENGTWEAQKKSRQEIWCPYCSPIVYIYILCACVHTYTHVNLCLHVNPSFPADAAGVRWWVWRQQIAPTSAFMEPGACSCQSKTRGRICKTHSEAKYRIERHCPATTRNSVCLWAPILRALRYNNIIYIYI